MGLACSDEFNYTRASVGLTEDELRLEREKAKLLLELNQVREEAQLYDSVLKERYESTIAELTESFTVRQNELQLSLLEKEQELRSFQQEAQIYSMAQQEQHENELTEIRANLRRKEQTLQEKEEEMNQLILEKETELLRVRLKLEQQNAENMVLNKRMGNSLFRQVVNSVGNLIGGDDQVELLKSELRQLEIKKEQATREAKNKERRLKQLEMYQENKENSACVICLDETVKVDALFIPCGHMNCCYNCATNGNIVTCPICRTPIQQKMRVYS